MKKHELKDLLKLQMKQASELLDLDTTKEEPDHFWSNSPFSLKRAELFQILKSIRHNSIELEKMEYRYPEEEE